MNNESLGIPCPYLSQDDGNSVAEVETGLQPAARYRARVAHEPQFLLCQTSLLAPKHKRRRPPRRGCGTGGGTASSTAAGGIIGSYRSCWRRWRQQQLGHGLRELPDQVPEAGMCEPGGTGTAGEAYTSCSKPGQGAA